MIIGGLGQGAMMLWIGGYTGIHTSGTVVGASYVSIVAVYVYAINWRNGIPGWDDMPLVVARRKKVRSHAKAR